MNIEKILDSLKTVKLTGGIFGKITLLLIVVCVCCTAIILATGIWWFSLSIVLILIILVFYALKRSFDFAKENPEAAIMEGAELLVHEKIVHGIKDQGLISPKEPVIDHEPPIIPEHEILSEDPPPVREIEQDRAPDAEERD